MRRHQFAGLRLIAMRTGKAPRKVELRQFIRNFADGAAFPVLELHRTQGANLLVEVREDARGLGEPEVGLPSVEIRTL